MNRATALAHSLICPLLGCRADPQKNPSVIVVMVDALRADYLGTYGFKGGVSPNLDRLAAESVVFENAFSQAPWTKPSVATLFTSLYPLAHGLTDQAEQSPGGKSALRTGVLTAQAVTMAEVFRAADYRTAAFVGNSWLDAAFGFDQGFETYETPRNTRALLDKATAWLDSIPSGTPFFLYLHLMDVHTPYFAQEKDYRVLRSSPSLGPDRRLTEAEKRELAAHLRRTQWDTPDDREWLNGWKAKYAGGVRTVDRNLALFLEYLRQADILDASLLVLTADHGEEFREHDFWEHGAGLCEHQLHVPLWIRRPGVEGAGRRVTEVVSLVDLMPTLLSLASLPAPSSLQGSDFSTLLVGEDPAYGGGVSFATALQGDPGLHSVRDSRYRLLWEGDTDMLQLFDVDSDPDEEHDIAPRNPELAEALRRRLVAHIESVSAQTPLSGETTPLIKEIEERLESLGYLH
jgi:arylsulfatase A-like enzyme